MNVEHVLFWLVVGGVIGGLIGLGQKGGWRSGCEGSGIGMLLALLAWWVWWLQIGRYP
jgi:hypothetical protein